MKKNSYAELSDDALLKKIQLLKGVSIGFGVLYAIIIVVLLFLFFNKNFGKASVAVFVPLLVFPAILSPILINYNLLKKEYKSRNL